MPETRSLLEAVSPPLASRSHHSEHEGVNVIGTSTRWTMTAPGAENVGETQRAHLPRGRAQFFVASAGSLLAVAVIGWLGVHAVSTRVEGVRGVSGGVEGAPWEGSLLGQPLDETGEKMAFAVAPQSVPARTTQKPGRTSRASTSWEGGWALETAARGEKASAGEEWESSHRQPVLPRWATPGVQRPGEEPSLAQASLGDGLRRKTETGLNDGDVGQMIDHGGLGALPFAAAMKEIKRRERVRWQREQERQGEGQVEKTSSEGAKDGKHLATPYLGALKVGEFPSLAQPHNRDTTRQGLAPLDPSLFLPLNPFQELNAQQHRDIGAVYKSFGWELMAEEASMRWEKSGGEAKASEDQKPEQRKTGGETGLKPLQGLGLAPELRSATMSMMAKAARDARMEGKARGQKPFAAATSVDEVDAVAPKPDTGAIASSSEGKPEEVKPEGAVAASTSEEVQPVHEPNADKVDLSSPKPSSGVPKVKPHRAVGRSELEERVGVARADAEMPPMIFLKVPECGEESISGLVRRAALRHGLRGAWSDVTGTMRELSSRPDGTPVMVSEDLSLGELRAIPGVEDEVWGDAFRMTFVRDPFRRAISAFMHRGHEQSGWQVTAENLRAFLHGELGEIASKFHCDNYMIRRIAPPAVIAKLDAGEVLTDSDIWSTLDQFTLVGTLEKRDQSLVLMKLLLPMMSLMDITEAPKDVGWGSTDAFGFERHETTKADDFPPSVYEMLSSPAFVDAFVHANAADFRLVELANQRLERRIAGRRESFASHLNRYHTMNARVAKRVRLTPEWMAAEQAQTLPPSTSAVKPCPLGSERDCIGQLFRTAPDKSSPLMKLAQAAPGFGNAETALLGALLLQDQAHRHRSEKCLYMNEGCFAQTVDNIVLDEYAQEAAQKAADLTERSLTHVPNLGEAQKDNKPRWTAEYAAACVDAAMVASPRMCDNRETMGEGVVGKKLAAMASHVYVLCYKDQCERVCVPMMWASKATLMDGNKVDKCFGVLEEVHVVRATMSHAAAVAHAAVNRHPSMAMIEADSIFVDPNDGKFHRGNTAATAASKDTASLGNEVNIAKDKTWGTDDFKTMRRMIARAGRVANAATVWASGHGENLDEVNEDDTEEEGLIPGGLNGTDSELRMMMIRLGYRVRNFEVGESSCRAPCGCVQSPGNSYWCTVYSTSCDLRGANAYILIADAYPLVLSPILHNGPNVSANNVIDHFVLQTIPQQVITTPMLTVQDGTHPHAQKVYAPLEQLRDADSYLKVCVTGRGGRKGLPLWVAETTRGDIKETE